MLHQERPDQERSVLLAWGEVIRRYRRWKQLSRRELAQRAGLSPVFLGEIERGEKDPSSHSLCLVAQALDVPLTEMYLRVAVRLDRRSRSDVRAGQMSLPLGIRESPGDYLDAVPPMADETAFDLYRIARRLRADLQLSLLVLAQSLEGGGADSTENDRSP